MVVGVLVIRLVGAWWWFCHGEVWHETRAAGLIIPEVFG
jgi:hypothetical protein